MSFTFFVSINDDDDDDDDGHGHSPLRRAVAITGFGHYTFYTICEQLLDGYGLKHHVLS